MRERPSIAFQFVSLCSPPPVPPNRYFGPRWRCADRLRRASCGQDIWGGPRDHSEHEQSGGLALQQSQEANIRSAPVELIPVSHNSINAMMSFLWRDYYTRWPLFCLQSAFCLPPQRECGHRSSCLKWRGPVRPPSIAHFKLGGKRGGGRGDYKHLTTQQANKPADLLKTTQQNN